MRVAILHFHLRAGGVTRVIEMACEALLRENCEPLVISGEPPPPDCRIPGELVAVVPDLAYGVGANRAGRLRVEVDLAMRRRWQSPADIVHTHNHSLGKNFALPRAVSGWAEDGQAMLLQIHDFAENGRPGNYRRLVAELGSQRDLDHCLYPMAPRIGYATLNSADQERLIRAGLRSACELLPNPVSLPAGGSPVEGRDLGAGRLIVYPTRAIRRKNLGEALFWAALAEPEERIILTAAPQNEPDRSLHEEWKMFARSLDLPVVFDAQNVLRRPTADFLLGADVCLTTSIAEGFGMAFLEPWLAGRSVAGRDLPAVTKDFHQAGLVLDGLYERLDVPLDWIGVEAVRHLADATIRAACAAYAVDFQEDFVPLAMSALVREERVDFGRLDEPLQRKAIQRVRKEPDSAKEISAKLCRGTAHLVRNRRVVQERFSLAGYGLRLREIYDGICSQPVLPPSHLDASLVLKTCLSFEDFHALRS